MLFTIFASSKLTVKSVQILHDLFNNNEIFKIFKISVNFKVTRKQSIFSKAHMIFSLNFDTLNFESLNFF